MRGKLGDIGGCNIKNRITPADAGKTNVAFLQYFLQQDHPRGCGENPSGRRRREEGSGSPPRMRGKLGNAECVTGNAGITPADAGKTVRFVLADLAVQDHPRGCGENYVSTLLGCRLSGSPPRMRGKLADAHVRRQCGRITPADAGKTSVAAI